VGRHGHERRLVRRLRLSHGRKAAGRKAEAGDEAQGSDYGDAVRFQNNPLEWRR
jgi:hypothetical protein